MARRAANAETVETAQFEEDASQYYKGDLTDRFWWYLMCRILIAILRQVSK